MTQVSIRMRLWFLEQLPLIKAELRTIGCNLLDAIFIEPENDATLANVDVELYNEQSLASHP